MLMTHVCNHVLYCLIKPYCSLSSLMQDRHEKGAMFVNVRKYNGLYVFSLIYPRSCRIIHQKPRRTNCPCFYYANSSTSRQTLLRGGDISVNPGSLAKQKSAKCEECEKTVRLNLQCHHYGPLIPRAWSCRLINSLLQLML